MPLPSSSVGERIRLHGVVQGVGLRPLVWRFAQQLGLAGSVRNDGQGVVIEVHGDSAAIEQLVVQLSAQLPPLARLDAITRESLAAAPVATGFEILSSGDGPTVATQIPPDAATCTECLHEIMTPGHRRYRYPFTSCTHCGPRFSIIEQLPYDRAHTSLAPFAMCAACQAEYDAPADRRFHAQTNACPVCGPQLWLQRRDGQRVEAVDVIEAAAALLLKGQIIAFKGDGGFHLACDAGDEEAVQRLRQRKQRPHKPLALLARDVAMVARYAQLDDSIDVLRSVAAPIVLLAQHGEALAASVAPGQSCLGFALASTPLQHLLMAALPRPLVWTSANVSVDAPCIDNAAALSTLSEIADFYVLHDRAIANRLDDSVIDMRGGQPLMLRRARGYAPAGWALPAGFEHAPPVLAMGADLKATFCLLQSGKALLSPHIGDLQNATVLDDYRRQLARYQALYPQPPALIAVDRHPHYQSHVLGHALAQARQIPCVEVQHHHAHVAAVMAEHGVPLYGPPVLGVVLDGLGMGDDGQLWGGEFLLADYRGYRRLAALDAVPLLGGAQAMRQPWRNTVAQLLHCFEWSTINDQFGALPLFDYLNSKPIAQLQTMQQQGINSPACSSAGRLFDAVAAALDVCREQQTYEGQAAMALEALAASTSETEAYPFEWVSRDGIERLCWRPMWSALLQDLHQGVAWPLIAARFHHTLAEAVVTMVHGLCRIHEVDRVVLGGGVLSNRLLRGALQRRLSAQGLEVLLPAQLPAGDGAVALGQAVVAAAQQA